MSSPIFSSLLIVLSIISAAQMSTPECGCIRRPTFDQDWIQDNYPNLVTANPGYTFSTPNVTYPGCASIVATCPNGQIVSNVEFNTGKLTIGGNLFPNPTILSDLLCDNHVWYNAGLLSEMDTNINSSAVGCALKK